MTISILQAGPLLTLQDQGRSVRRWGVPQSGAVDQFAYAVGQRLVGNYPYQAALELTWGPCSFYTTMTTVAVLTGAEMQATLDDQPVTAWQTFLWRAGSTLHCQPCQVGARAYLALQAGVALAPQLGSRSTLINGPFAGLLGRPLRMGDSLPLVTPDLAYAGRSWPSPPHYAQQNTVRFLPGPHFTQDISSMQTWIVDPASNRMGLRLHGQPWLHSQCQEIRSMGVLPGGIQLPPSGLPIVLLADAQTTGGYPIFGTVITADLPILAQVQPGSRLQFQRTTPDLALAALLEQQRLINQPLPNDEFLAAPI